MVNAAVVPPGAFGAVNPALAHTGMFGAVNLALAPTEAFGMVILPLAPTGAIGVKTGQTPHPYINGKCVLNGLIYLFDGPFDVPR